MRRRKTEFGEFVRTRRKGLRYSGAELARRANIDSSYISLIESGVYPSRDVAWAVLGALELSQWERIHWYKVAGYCLREGENING